MAAIKAHRRVLDEVLVAQAQKRDGYAQALREIKAGRKSSHWIWYIWPCLQELRPRTSRPQYLLPNLEAARRYLGDETLRMRLLEITRVATAHLAKGADAKKLFGGGGDWEKFWETNTFFALAACLNSDRETIEVCCAALEAGVYKGALHTRTVELIVDGYGYGDFESCRHGRVADVQRAFEEMAARQDNDEPAEDAVEEPGQVVVGPFNPA